MVQQYDYESLGADAFQQLCQAVLTRSYRDVQCFPVGMPDGGRDASTPSPVSPDSVIFQVKFRKPTPNKLATPDEICAWAEQKIKGEIPQIRNLAQRGASKYILMTNAQCSSHSDVGTRDRMQAWLDQNLPIPAQVWWRDDIDRRLDGETEIKRTYGLIRDFAGFAELLGLRDEKQSEEELIKAAKRDRRIAALFKYLRHQYKRDRFVKFKQAELEPQLLDVFVDVPSVDAEVAAEFYYNSDKGYTRFWVPSREPNSEVLARWAGLLAPDAHEVFANNRINSGYPTATVLLANDDPHQGNLSKVVIEGAPGQGKSTLGQYMCQLHRARLLGLNEEIERFPTEHRSSPVRLPFHVDLRDLATWLRKHDPFDVTNSGTPPFWGDSLESFLAAQVRHDSGGMDFTVSDLDAVVSATPILLVLDGLDEVPDLNDRRAIVNAVNEGINRLEFFCPSMRTVITSRPSSFAKTPGFSKKDYRYLVLIDLPLDLVLQYTDGWLRARDIPHEAEFETRKALGERLGHQHIADLARNPMQLAILLWLVRRKGPSLPDKRTALYGGYMETFLDREAEKSAIVADQSELILELHGYIAWELHCKSEVGASTGSISKTKLKSLLKRYLSVEGYETDLIDQLFTGMTQRVMVLTSRVENTFEFEIQPLREYFAARYLYSTARMSPPGSERTGTRSDRFEALLRNPYWWNVTRFYAGFSDKGELANVVDLLQTLCSEGDFALSAYSRQVCATLLRDQVFSQRPRSIPYVMDLFSGEDALAVLVAGDSTALKESLTLPAGSGGSELADRTRALVETGVRTRRPYRNAALVMSANQPLKITRDWWFTKWLEAPNEASRHQWLEAGARTRALESATDEQLSLIVKSSPREILTWRTLLMSNCGRAAYLGVDEFDSYLHALREGVGFPIPHATRISREGPEAVLHITSLEFLSLIAQSGSSYADYTYKSFLLERSRKFEEGHSAEVFFESIIAAFTQLVDSNPHNNLMAWESAEQRLVELLGGECRRTLLMALCAGSVRSGNVIRRDADGLFDTSKPASRRARYARQRRKDADWWQEQASAVTTVQESWFLLCALLKWAPRSVLFDVGKQIDTWVSQLSLSDLMAARNLFRLPSSWRSDDSDSLTPIPRGLSANTLFAFSLRAQRHTALTLLDASIRKSKDKNLTGLFSAAKIEAMLSHGHGWNLDMAQLADAYIASERTFSAPGLRLAAAQRMPVPIAREVLRNPARMHPFVILAANRALTGEISRKAVPLSHIAKQDGWFTEGLD